MKKIKTDNFSLAQVLFYENRFEEAIDFFTKSDTTENVKAWWLACCHFELGEFYRLLEEDFHIYEQTSLVSLIDEYPDRKEFAVLLALNRLTESQCYETDSKSWAVKVLRNYFGGSKAEAILNIYRFIFKAGAGETSGGNIDRSMEKVRKIEFFKDLYRDLKSLIILKKSPNKFKKDLLPDQPGFYRTTISGDFLPEEQKSPLYFGCTLYYRMISIFHFKRVEEFCRRYAEDTSFKLLYSLASYYLGQQYRFAEIVEKIDPATLGDEVEPFWPEYLKDELDLLYIQILMLNREESEAQQKWRILVENSDFSRSYAPARGSIGKYGRDVLRLPDGYWDEIRGYLLGREVRSLAESCEDEFGTFLCPKSLSYLYLSAYYVLEHSSLRADLKNRIELVGILDLGIILPEESISTVYNPNDYLLLKARAFINCKEFDRAMEIYNELVKVYPDMNIIRRQVQIIYGLLQTGGGGKVILG